MISSSFNPIADPNYATLYAPYYDAVPFGTPTITETDPSGNVVDPTVRVDVGDTLTANVATISDFDGMGAFNYQWQYQDVLAGDWINFTGATSSTFKIPAFLNTMLGVRVKVSYVDGKGYTEQVISAPTTAVTVSGAVNTPPRVVPQQQFNGIPNTTALVGAPFDFFSPFGEIFTDDQTASNALTYTAILANGQPLSTVGLAFSFDPNAIGAAGAAAAGLPGVGEFSLLPGLDPNTGLPYALDTAGQIAVRVIATDPGGLSVTDTFVINVVPPNSPPNANDDTYTTPENVGLTTLLSTGVLHNDVDPNADPFTAALVTGPTNGTLTFHADGTFVYIPNHNFVGTDSFTYQDTDSAGAVSNIATATINVVNVGKITVVPTAPATTNSVTETFTVGALTPAPGSAHPQLGHLDRWRAVDADGRCLGDLPACRDRPNRDLPAGNSILPECRQHGHRHVGSGLLHLRQRPRR